MNIAATKTVEHALTNEFDLQHVESQVHLVCGARFCKLTKVVFLLLFIFGNVQAFALDVAANQSVTISNIVQPKLVKIYGAGGFGGLESYQSGFFITDQGHILTTWSTVLDVSTIRVVTSDGVRHDASIVGSDPTTELAIIKIELEGNEYFPIDEALNVSPGTRIYACSNLFNIAAGQEPFSIQKGVVMATTQLSARRGRLKTIYQGPILVLDAMTNNPGATGGVVIDLQGRAVGLLGKELRDEGAGIYMNFALPNSILASSVQRILSGEVVIAKRDAQMPKAQNPHSLVDLGITLVPDVLNKTPPYIDHVTDGSVAARSGLLANDLVLLINNQRVDSQKTLRELLATVNRNDNFVMLIQRGQELLQVDVKP